MPQSLNFRLLSIILRILILQYYKAYYNLLEFDRLIFEELQLYAALLHLRRLKH